MNREFETGRFLLIAMLLTGVMTPGIAYTLNTVGFSPGATVTVDNTPPSVGIPASFGGTVNVKSGNSITIRFSASVTTSTEGGEDVAEGSAECAVDSQSLTVTQDQSSPSIVGHDLDGDGVIDVYITTFTYHADFSSWSDGTSYTAQVSVSDDVGNVGSDSASFTANKDVQITKGWIKPSDGATLRGTVTIAIRAYPTSAVGSVTFKVDGSTSGVGLSTATVSSPSDVDGDGTKNEWEVSWDTSQVEDGQHTLKASFTDDNGHSHTLGMIIGSEQDSGISKAFNIPIFIWLMSLGMSITMSGIIAYVVERRFI